MIGLTILTLISINIILNIKSQVSIDKIAMHQNLNNRENTQIAFSARDALFARIPG
jgi:hypothetical protein